MSYVTTRKQLSLSIVPHSEESKLVSALLIRLREKVKGRFSAMRSVFLEMDDDRSGRIDFSKLRALLLRFQIELTDTDLTTLMRFLDTNGDGLLEFRDITAFLSVEDETMAPSPFKRASSYASVFATSASARSTAATESLRKKIREGIADKFQTVQEAFLRINTSGDGKVTKDEFTALLRGRNFNLTIPEMDELMRCVDANRDGQIDFDDFSRFLRLRQPESEADERVPILFSRLTELASKRDFEVMKRIYEKMLVLPESPDALFRRFDEDRDGQLTCDDFARMVKALNVHVTAEDVSRLVKILDDDDNGYIEESGIMALFSADSELKTVAGHRRALASSSSSDGEDDDASEDGSSSAFARAGEKRLRSLGARLVPLFSLHSSALAAAFQNAQFISVSQFQALLSSLGHTLSPPDMGHLLLFLDPDRTGTVESSRIRSFAEQYCRVKWSEQLPSAERDPLSEGEIANIRKRIPWPVSQASTAKVHEILVRVVLKDCFTVASVLQESLKSATTERRCSPREFRRALQTAGIICADPEFDLFWKLLDVPGEGSIPFDVMGIRCRRAVAYAEYLMGLAASDSASRGRESQMFSRPRSSRKT